MRLSSFASRNVCIYNKSKAFTYMNAGVYANVKNGSVCKHFVTCMLLYISSHINSQSLSTLSVIEDFLSKRPMPSGIASSEPRSQNWVRNLNYYSESSSLCSVSSPPLRSISKKTQKSFNTCCSSTAFYFFTFTIGTLLPWNNSKHHLWFESVFSETSISMKYTNIHSYCRWSNVLYVSVNETMSRLSSGLDGSTSASERERLINQFNDPENKAAWVFLLSTRYRPLLPFFPPDIPWWTCRHSVSTRVCFIIFLERVAWG